MLVMHVVLLAVVAGAAVVSPALQQVVSVSSGDGLTFDFPTSGTGVAGVTIAGASVSPTNPSPSLTGFGVADYLVPATPTGGPELLRNSRFAEPGANASIAAFWTPVGDPAAHKPGGRPHGGVTRVGNVTRSPGGFSMMVDGSGGGGGGGGVTQGVAFARAPIGPRGRMLVLSGWSKASIKFTIDIIAPPLQNGAKICI